MHKRKDHEPERPELSVVVPLFNEEALIDELIRRLDKACGACSETYEIIIVNDGSYDHTLSLLIEASTRHPELVVVNLSRNFGHMQALTAGLQQATGKAVVVMDGDLQDPPELIIELMDKWRHGAEVVLARRIRRGEPFLQRFLTNWFYRILGVIGNISIPKQAGTFCLMDQVVVDIINKLPERIRYFAGMRSWVGFQTEVVNYNRPIRQKGMSKVGLIGQFSLAKKGIISFSSWPLIWLSRFSLLASLALFFFGLCVLGIKFFSDLATPNWASNMVLIGMVSSLNSAVFAVISEYMAVIFDEIKDRPVFVIARIYRNGSAINEL